MIHFAPQAIDALHCGFKYIAQNETVFAWVSKSRSEKGLGYYSISELEPFIPKVYRYPGYVLYDLYDKEYMLSRDYRSANWEEWFKRMDDDDIYLRLNKVPNVEFIFPQSVLPTRFKQAIAIKKMEISPEELANYFPDKDLKEAGRIYWRILSADKGFMKEAEHLMKSLNIRL